MKFGLRRRKASSTIRGRVFSMTQSISEEEERFILLGMSFAARVLIVVHCYREQEQVVRIISARKATRKEAGFYEEGI
jgi:uncharacterized DUF497 family protein